MRYTFLYLILVALIAATMATTISSFAQDVTCSLGSYGKIIEQSHGHCR